MSSHSPTPNHNGWRTTASTHAEFLRELLAGDDDEFRRHAVIEGSDAATPHSSFRKLQRVSLVVAAGTDDQGRTLYRIADDYREEVEQTVAERNWTPCGHTGVRTVAAGETYTCQRDDCDARFDRATAEEVLG